MNDQTQLKKKLSEQEKLLHGFFTLSELAGSKDLTLDGICQRFIELLPSSLRHSDRAYGRLNILGREYRSSGYQDTPWRITIPVQRLETEIGFIEIGYLENFSLDEEGPFSPDEQRFLQTMAEQISHLGQLRQIETTLNQSLSRYHLIADHTSDVIWVMDAKTEKLTYASPSVQKLLGFSPDEIVGHYLKEILTPESYLKASLAISDEMIAVLSTSTSFDPIRIEHIRKDGTPVDTEVSTSLAFDEDGRPLIIGISRDITDRKKAEDELRVSLNTTRAILESTLEQVFLVDTDGIILAVNEAAANVFALPQNDLIGHALYSFLSPKAIDILHVRFEQVIEKGVAVSFEDESQGEYKKITLYPVFANDGTVNRISIYAENITAQKQAEIQKAQFYEDLDFVNQIINSINRGVEVNLLTLQMKNLLKKVFRADSLTIFLLSDDRLSLTASDFTNIDDDKHVYFANLNRRIGSEVPAKVISLAEAEVFASAIKVKTGSVVTDPDQIMKRIIAITQSISPSSVPETTRAGIYQEIAAFLGVKSIISVPMLFDDEVIGLIEVSSKNIYTEQDLVRLQGLLGQISLATLHRKAENDLRIMNNRFEMLSGNIPEVFWIFDYRSQKFVYISTAFEKIWGLNRDAMNDDFNYVLNQIHPDDQQELLDSRERVRAGYPSELEYRILHPGGSVRTIWERSFPVFGQDGTVTHYTGVSSDISASKRVEMELKEHESFLQSIVTSVPGTIFLVDLGGYFLYTNHPVTDVSDEQFYKRNFLRGVHPQHEKQAVALFNKSIQTKSIQQAEMQLLQHNAEYRWMLVLFSPVIIDDEVKRMTIHTIDIHERKQAEEMLRKVEDFRRSMLEAINESIFLVDSDGMGVMANSVTLKRLNVTEEEFIGHSIYDILPPEVREIRREKMKQAIETRTPVKWEDVRYGRQILNVANPIMDENQNVTLLAMFAFDITDQKLAEEQNRRFAHIIEQMADTVLVLDQNWQIQYANAAFEKISGYSLEEIRGKTPKSILGSEQHKDDFYEEMNAALQRGEVFVAEFKNRKKDGGIFYEIKTSTPLIDSDGNITNFIETGKDITERIRAEERFISSELRNRTMVEAIPDVLFRVTRDGTFLDFHAKNTDKLFAPPQTYIGRKIDQMVPESISQPYMKAVQKAFEQDSLQIFHYQTHKGSENYTFEGRVVANLAANEAVVIVRDITEQQQMEIELRHSEEKYRRLSEVLEQRVIERTAEIQDLYDNAPIGYHSLNDDGVYQMINETELHWLGYSRDEIIGKKSFGDFLFPEEYQRYKTEFNRIKELGYTYNLEFDLIRKDGSRLPVIVNAVAVYDKDRKFLHTRSTMFNNTERKAIEAEIRRINNLSETAFELAKSGYWYIPLDDPDYYYPSDRVIEIHGDEKHSDTRYHLKSEWLINLQMANPDIASGVKAAFDDVIFGRSDRVDQQYPYRRPVDGKIIWIHARGNVVYDSAGRRIGISGVTQDITDQKEMEWELSKAKEAAETANMAKSAFLANMSHEIRTPMNAILGFTQIMMKDKTLDAKSREYVGIINRSGEHLLTIINEILEMSKIESGHVTYNPITFHLPSLINDIKDMFLPRLAAKDLSMTVELDPRLPKYICTDETKLKEILINLLGNALKFTNTGGVTLRCWSEKDPSKTDPAGLLLFIDVEDTGIGIAQEDIPHVFTAFEQSRGSDHSHSGTGLGLAISLSHARLLGGNITISSTRYVGTCMHVILAVTESKGIKARTLSPKRQVTGLKPDAPEIKVMIVDDNEDNRKVIQEMLEPLGILTCNAQDGAEAVEMTRSWVPDLILMDLRMPVMDGYEAASIIKATEAGKEIHIIAVTASPLEIDEQRILNSGMSGYVRKPFKEHQLFSILEAKFGKIFVYSDEEQSDENKSASSSSEVTWQEIQTIPHDLVEQLKAATINAQFDQILMLIQKIAKYAPKTSILLQKLADGYQYDSLIKLFEQEDTNGH